MNPLLLMMAGIILLSVFLVLYLMTRRKKQSDETTLITAKQRDPLRKYVRLYDWIDSLPFARLPMRRRFNEYKRMYPSGKDAIVLAAKDVLRAIVITFVSFFSLCWAVPWFFHAFDDVVFTGNVTWVHYLTAAFTSFVLTTQLQASGSIRRELEFLAKMEYFLGEIKHYYYQTHDVVFTFFEIAGLEDRTIAGHANMLHDVLNSENVDAEMRGYISQGFNKYLKQLLTVSHSISERGDPPGKKGKSSYTESLLQMKHDIQEDQRDLKKRQAEFALHGYLAGLVFIMTPYVAEWCISVIPSQANFYYGRYGIFWIVALFALSVISYNKCRYYRDGEKLPRPAYRFAEILSIIPPFNILVAAMMMRKGKGYVNALEDDLKHYGERFNVRTLYMQQLLCGLVTAVVLSLTLTIGIGNERNLLLDDITELDVKLSNVDTIQLEAVKKVYPDYVQGLYAEGVYPDPAVVKQQLLSENGVHTEEAAGLAAVAICERVEYLLEIQPYWWEALLIIGFSLLMFRYPWTELLFRARLIGSRRQDEVIQFQSLINMMKDIPGISLLDLLEAMEMFSYTFRASLQDCINNFNVNDREALTKLYEAESYEAFRHLIECFLMADDLGIENSFDEVSDEIDNFAENRKTDRQILIEKQATKSAFISIIPGTALMGGYMILPFVLGSLASFGDFSSILTGFI